MRPTPAKTLEADQQTLHASKAGIRVFEMDGLSTKEVKTFKTRLNPQTQML